MFFEWLWTPWLIGATALIFLLVAIFVLFRKTCIAGKQLENLVNDRTSELKDAITKLKAVISNYKGIIWSIDKEGVITTFNGQYLKIIGLKSSFIEGKSLEAARLKSGHLEIVENVEKTFRENSAHDWINEINGDIFHSRTAPIYDGNGNMIGVVGSTDDVTEAVRLQQELEAAIIAVQAASHAKSAFIANMSHEIRTPMNSIIGFSELAMDDDIPQKTRDYLSKIKENSSWLLQIINDILDISKIESGKMELETVPFKLNDVLTRCQAIISPKALEKGIYLHFYAEPVLGGMLLGDPVRLGQVLINILGNAVKFTNVGTIKLSSTVNHTDENSNTIHFEIRDSGIGMTSEQMSRIFEPFTQADSSTTRKYGGTGLGLAITKNIIELMGGKLKVESTQGIGSKFSFDLTFDTIDTSDDAPVAENDNDTIEKPVFSGTILVCEDNRMNQMVISEHLAKVGLKAIIAENGQIGVDMIRHRMESGEPPFDLVFMDMHMPVMDGFEAAQKIMELDTGTPVVAMTANIMPEDKKLYKATGMNDYVGKPFTSQELWHCLLKYLKPVSPGVAADVGSSADTSTGDAPHLSSKQHWHPQDDDDLMLKLKVLFFNENREKFKEIAAAIDAGDIKLAYRLAHTLKSNAGQLGKTALQKAAGDIEVLLRDGKDLTTKLHMDIFAAELSAVLKELAPFAEAESVTRIEAGVESFDIEKARELFSVLEPLLKSGNPECLNLIGTLYAIPESGDLIRQIEDFDFEPAVSTLAELKRKMGT